MTKKQWHLPELHAKLLDVVSQYSTGLITDIEFLQFCQEIQGMYAEQDLTGLSDPNTGLRFPKGFNPFAPKVEVPRKAKPHSWVGWVTE